MGLNKERRRPNSGAAAMMGPCSAAARHSCSCSRGEAGARCGPPNSAARAQLPLPSQELHRGSGAAPTPSSATAVGRGEIKPRGQGRREAMGKHCNGRAWSRQQEKDATSSRMQHAIPGRRSPAPSPRHPAPFPNNYPWTTLLAVLSPTLASGRGGGRDPSLTFIYYCFLPPLHVFYS